MKAGDLLYYKSNTDFKQDACMVVVKTYPENDRVLLDQYTNWENGTKSQAQYRGRQELPIQEAEQLFEPMTDYEKIKAFAESISATFFKQTPQYIDFHRCEQNADVYEAAMFAHQSAVGALMIAALDKTPMELCKEASYFKGSYAFDDLTTEEDKDHYIDSTFYVGTYAGCNIYYDISAALDENKNPEIYESDRNGTSGYGYIENMGEVLPIDIPEDVKRKVQKQAGEYIEKEFIISESSAFLDAKEDETQPQKCVTEKPRLLWSTQNSEFYNSDQFKYNDNSEDYEGHAQFTFTIGEYRNNPIHVDISGYVDNNNEVSVYGDDSDCDCGYVNIDGVDTLITVPDEIMEKVKAQAAKLTLQWNAEAEKRESLYENDFEVREGNGMVINDRLLPIEQDTKTLLVIEVKKQDGTGNSYTVAAAAQSNESESLKAIIKGAMKGISKGGTLPFQLESYMAAHERYAKATSEDPEIKVVVSACKNGKVVSSEEKHFSLEQFKNKEIHFEKAEQETVIEK